MEPKLVPLSELGRRELARWRELADRSLEPNPFFDPSFVLPAARSVGESDDVAIMRMERDGDWVACLPVVIERKLVGSPFVLATWRNPYSFLGTPLVAPGHLESFATALAMTVRQRDHGRFLALRGCGEGRVLEAIRAAVADHGRLTTAYEDCHRRATLERRENADYFEGIKPRHRREMARLRRRLGDELEGEVRTVDRTDDREAPAEFLQLEASGWKGRAGTAMATSGDRDFFHSICDDFRAMGRLRLLALEGGGQTVAMKVDLSAGDTLYGFKIGFDERYAHYSPGVLLEVDSVGLFHERRSERLFDSCAQAGNRMINRLWPDRRSIDTVVLGRRGPSTGALRIARLALAANGGGGG